MTPRTMKAAVLRGHGGPDQRVYREDVPVPEPGPGQVRAWPRSRRRPRPKRCEKSELMSYFSVARRTWSHGSTRRSGNARSRWPPTSEGGRLKPLLAGTYPLAQIRRAQEDVLSKQFVGKLVLIPSAR